MGFLPLLKWTVRAKLKGKHDISDEHLKHYSLPKPFRKKRKTRESHENNKAFVPESPPPHLASCCYPTFGWPNPNESDLTKTTEAYGPGGSTDDCCNGSEGGGNCNSNCGSNGGHGGGFTNASGDDANTWDEPDGFGMLWPDDPDNAHPFTRASLVGDVNIVREYARRPTFDPGAKKSQHALLAACRAGHLDVVKTLIDAGVDVHCKDSKSNWQPIHISTYRDHVGIVECLAMQGEWRRGVALVRFKGVTCSLLHLAAHFGCVAVLRYLLSHTVRLGLHVEVRDAAHWTALHHAAFEGKTQCVTLLLQSGADVNSADPHGVTPMHAAAYRDHANVVRLLLSKGANPKFSVKSTTAARRSGKRLPRFDISHSESDDSYIPVGHGKASIDTLLPPYRRRYWSPSLPTTPEMRSYDNGDTGTIGRWKGHSVPWGGVFSPILYPIAEPPVCPQTGIHERGFERVEPIVKYHEGSSFLHWASSKGYSDLVADLLARGLLVDSGDRLGRTPLGLAVWSGHTEIVKMFLHEKVELAEEDKNWHRITGEDVGLTIVRILEETNVSNLECSRSDGFTLLHLAAHNGYPNMMHRLLSLKVSPDLINNQGETPLFVAIRSNQLACVQQLINAGTKLSVVDNRGGTALHMAAKNGNVTVIDMLLTTSEHEERDIDINRTDNIGYSAVYYAINASRYDIVQRFLEYSLVRKVHVKATKNETLLQFYTERNNLGQYDNAVVRVLECEKLLHTSKANAEMCLRVQLGTTEASTKARIQLQQMYESTKAQRHCWNFWFFLSCFLLPSIFYYLDVYTDILLAVEYYQDYQEDLLNSSLYSNVTNSTDFMMETFWEIFHDITDSQHKINFVLTVFFILLPMSLLSMWNLYIHVTQPDILPLFRKLPRLLRGLLYTLVFLTPLAPVMAYLENTYAQMKHMNVTARSLQEVDSKSCNSFPSYGNTKTYRHHLRDQKIRKYYDLKHVAQMRVAITNVMEATLESAFQLILQLYIVGTQYQDLTKVGEVTLRKILSFSTDGDTRLSKQVFSVLISLVSLTWSFTSYHRFSKLGGLTILSALPLLFAIFFQVFFMILALIENFVLLLTGIVGLDGTQFDPTFKTVSVVLCTLSYIIGVILHGVYYGCFGHPWVDINGPTLTKDPDDGTWILAYYRQGNINRWALYSCCKFRRYSQQPADNVYLPPHLIQMKFNGVHRQVKDI
ncbi:Ankyrin-1 [Armadillidium vulgare]|nr:Ankyrin-1 [Armadillidium vulgare]